MAGRKRRRGGKPRIRTANPNVDEFAKKMLGHFIPYEVGMMRALHKKLGKGSPTQLDRNADIESFHIHARNLVEFFTDDIQCAIDPRAFTEQRYQINGQFIPRNLETKISQQIVHLTHERTDVTADKLSDVEREQTVKAIEKEIVRFEKDLRPEWLPTWQAGLTQMNFEGELGAEEQALTYVVGPTGPAGPTPPPTLVIPENPVFGATNHVTSISSGTSKRDPSKKGPDGS